jgi:hypothetical protein
MLAMAKYVLLEIDSVMELFENIHHLAKLCVNSKRKRLPVLIGCLSLSKRIWY